MYTFSHVMIQIKTFLIFVALPYNLRKFEFSENITFSAFLMLCNLTMVLFQCRALTYKSNTDFLELNIWFC